MIDFTVIVKDQNVKTEVTSDCTSSKIYFCDKLMMPAERKIYLKLLDEFKLPLTCSNIDNWCQKVVLTKLYK
jgi:hypothetical protein